MLWYIERNVFLFNPSNKKVYLIEVYMLQHATIISKYKYNYKNNICTFVIEGRGSGPTLPDLTYTVIFLYVA